MLCSSSRRWAVRPLTLSHPNHMNKILLFLFRPQRLSFSSSSFSRTNIILKSQSESETHINTIIMEDEVSKQRRSMEFLSSKPYVPPQWASHLNPIPSHIFSLANVTNQHKQNKNSTSLLLLLYWISELFSIFCFCSFQLPTPIHKWNLPNLPNNTEVWLKVKNFLSFFYLYDKTSQSTNQRNCLLAC